MDTIAATAADHDDSKQKNGALIQHKSLLQWRDNNGCRIAAGVKQELEGFVQSLNLADFTRDIIGKDFCPVVVLVKGRINGKLLDLGIAKSLRNVVIRNVTYLIDSVLFAARKIANDRITISLDDVRGGAECVSRFCMRPVCAPQEIVVSDTEPGKRKRKKKEPVTNADVEESPRPAKKKRKKKKKETKCVVDEIVDSE